MEKLLEFRGICPLHCGAPSACVVFNNLDCQRNVQFDLFMLSRFPDLLVEKGKETKAPPRLAPFAPPAFLCKEKQAEHEKPAKLRVAALHSGTGVNSTAAEVGQNGSQHLSAWTEKKVYVLNDGNVPRELFRQLKMA